MMYGNKLAAAIKVNGKVLREFKDTVYIPFGSQYSILIKNLNTVRTVVDVFLDGENVVPGGLVLNAGQEIDLERWIKNGNLSEGPKFKFIERTSNIEDGPRGIKLEDGLIRVEYQFEKVVRQPEYVDHHIYHRDVHHWPTWRPYYYGQDVWYGEKYGAMGSAHTKTSLSNETTGILRGSTAVASVNAVNSVTTQGVLCNASVSDIKSYVANDVGITVPGSKSEQKFSTASWFPTETEKHSMVIKLLGETQDNKPVTKPVTVKNKPKCQTCGRQNKAQARFCQECGTALTIFA